MWWHKRRNQISSFGRNGRVHLNRPGGRQFIRLLEPEVCASAVVMLDTPCSEVVWRVLATQSIRQFPLHFPSRTLPCAITFQLDSTHPNFTTLISHPRSRVETKNKQFVFFPQKQRTKKSSRLLFWIRISKRRPLHPPDISRHVLCILSRWILLDKTEKFSSLGAASVKQTLYTGVSQTPGPGINYTGPREILLELITNLNVILYSSTCHTVHIIVLNLYDYAIINY